MDRTVIVVAAGSGKRFGRPKQFAYLRGKPVLEWTLEAFETHPEIDGIVLVLPDELDRKHYQMRYAKIREVVRGGERRQDSVWQGFRMMRAAPESLVLVHDGARPLVPADLISRVIAAVEESGGAVLPVLPLEDTLKEVETDRVVATPDRTRFFRAQTPQGFPHAILESALKRARADRFYGTDEALLAERAGFEVRTVPGDARNIKITTPLDIRIAEALLDGV